MTEPAYLLSYDDVHFLSELGILADDPEEIETQKTYEPQTKLGEKRRTYFSHKIDAERKLVDLYFHAQELESARKRLAKETYLEAIVGIMMNTDNLDDHVKSILKSEIENWGIGTLQAMVPVQYVEWVVAECYSRDISAWRAYVRREGWHDAL